MKKILFLLAGLIAFCVPQLALETTPQFGTVEGIVVKEDTDEPIPNVKISIGGLGVGMAGANAEAILDAAARGEDVPGDQLEAARARQSVGSGSIPSALTAETDSAGRFSIKDVPVGNVPVRATLQGYFGSISNGQITDRAKATAVVKSKETAQVKLTMIPAGTVSGTVFDSIGKPMFNAVVLLMRKAYVNGVATLEPLNGKTTDDRGEYRLYPLPPGEYYIGIQPYLPGGQRGDGPPVQQIPVMTLYPNADSITTATKIVLRPGEEISRIDVRIRSAAAATIAGKVTSTFPAVPVVNARGGTTREPIAGISLVPHNADSLQDTIGGLIATARADGTFKFTGVPPGIYDLYARLPIDIGWGPRNPPGVAAASWAFGRTTVEIRGGDLEGLPIVVHQGMDLKGRVLVDGVPRSSGVRVTVAVDDNTDRVGDGPTSNVYDQVSRYAPKLEQDGSFTIPMVPEGRFRVTARVTDSMPNAYVADIRQGATSVYDEGLLIGTSSPNPIEVVINSNGGTLDATVLGADQKPAPDMTVVLVPAAQRRKNPALYKTGRSDASGHVQLTNLPPGSYKLFAWENVTFGAWMNAEFIGSIEERGTAVTVNAGAKQSAQVKVISK
jgi:hypothetical protein